MVLVPLVGDDAADAPVGLDQHALRRRARDRDALVVDRQHVDRGAFLAHPRQRRPVLDVLARERVAGERGGELGVDGVAIGAQRVDAVHLRVDLAEALDHGIGAAQAVDRRSRAAEREQRRRAPRDRRGGAAAVSALR